ncbi:hypothetical protein [uncultured Piscinibacter sp.]|uniref:hypothetical protein n=1 Tax=uncultured Piscinibacter sp. TaxID=1131835 RepID=UPI00261B0C4C|nr:hypothetical protein [uncultured Piscinibacter sp.]
MNPVIGWALAALFVALAWQAYGWQGVLFAFSAVVFWLLLQFSRVMRAMRLAGRAPAGRVDSAVMLHAKLRPGMTLLQVIGLTRSLGRKLSDGDDDWSWRDEGGSSVHLHFARGKLVRFQLERPPGAGEPSPPAP